MTKENFAQILLVEDNKHDAELALMALEEINLADRVVRLKDGEEALHFIFAEGAYTGRNIEQQPKVILLDLKMPKVGGFEVLRRIRSDERTRRIPVVLFSSSGEEEDILQSYELGVNSYIVKPVDFDQLSRIINQIGSYWILLNQSPS